MLDLPSVDDIGVKPVTAATKEGKDVCQVTRCDELDYTVVDGSYNIDWKEYSEEKIKPANRKERRRMMRCLTYMTTAGESNRLSKSERDKLVEQQRKDVSDFLIKDWRD